MLLRYKVALLQNNSASYLSSRIESSTLYALKENPEGDIYVMRVVSVEEAADYCTDWLSGCAP